MRRSDGPVIVNGEMFALFFYLKMKARQVMVDIYQSLSFLLFLSFSAMSLCVIDGYCRVVHFLSFFSLRSVCFLHFSVRKDTGRETLSFVSVLVFLLH